MKTGGHEKGEQEKQNISPQEQSLCIRIVRKCCGIVRRCWDYFWFTGITNEARFAGWVARFTLVLCVVGAFQAWAFITSERAFIYQWTNFVSPSPLVAGKPITLTNNLRNSGRLGAFIIDVNLTYAFLKEPLPIEPHYQEGFANAVSGPIPAGTVFKATIALQRNDAALILTQPDIDVINNGTFHFYVFGWVKYKDAFSFFRAKKTGFCGVYVPTKSPDDAFNNCGRP